MLPLESLTAYQETVSSLLCNVNADDKIIIMIFVHTTLRSLTDLVVNLAKIPITISGLKIKQSLDIKGPLLSRLIFFSTQGDA